MADDRELLRLAVSRSLLPATTAQQCAQAASRVGQPAGRLLVERGLLSERVVFELERELQAAGATSLGAPAVASTIAGPSLDGATVAGPTVASRTHVPGAAPPPVATPPPTGDMTYAPYEEQAATRGGGGATTTGGPPSVGDIIGDFELLAQLGAGGMGVVFRARQRSLQREVALKLLGADHDSGFVERFVREARAAASVSHPNVVTTFAGGRDATTGVMFIAMELVKGGDAERLLTASGGRVPERRALEVIRDCARGLAALEQAGLVHRDIKPENIFLASDGTAKLGDLGLARRQSGEDRLTRTGEAVGTPAYMSPEQANGEKDLDARTDVYSLGASLFRLLTGRRPFEGSAAGIMYKIASEAPLDVRALAPDVSERAAALVARAMAKDRAARPQGGQALLAEVEAVLAPAPEAEPEAAPARSPALVLLAIVALLAAATAIAALAWSRA
jgi:hypothetical protein